MAYSDGGSPWFLQIRTIRTRHCTRDRSPCRYSGRGRCSLFWRGWNDFPLTSRVRSPHAWTINNLAQTARGDAAAMRRFIEAAAGEREKVAPGAKSTVDPRWTVLALAEAWSVSRLGLSNGNLNRFSAMSVITAIEAFASERAAVVA